MGKLAFLFAGQGAQSQGMGKSLHALGGKAAQVFETMETVRPGTMRDCFEGTAEQLAKTSITQPAVYTVDLAAAAALAERGVKPEGIAGFSLGEMVALTFAGVMDDETGARLVCKRGLLMEEAAAGQPGSMAAVLRLPDEKVEELCQGFSQLWPVNYNCPGQLVVAGSTAEIPAFCDAVKQAGGMAKPLPVGGAFHTPFMKQAAAAFAKELDAADMQPPQTLVYANLTAMPYPPAPGRETLAAQMHNPVRWNATIQKMWADGYDTFVELGPGKTLSGFVKRICPTAAIYNVQDEESLQATLEAIL